MLWDLNLISAKIFAPIIVILGFVGNLVGLIVISNKKLNNLGPQKIFICMFTLDCIYLPLVFHPYLAYAFQINITAMSNVACKVYWYARYSLAIISPMMNVYISVERFIAITFPARKLFLLKTNIQIAYIFMIIVVNFVFAVQVAIGFELQYVNINGPNQSESIVYYCDFSSLYQQDVAGYIDMTIRVIIPAGLMIIFSFLLSLSIFRSRKRISSAIASQAVLRKDVLFSMVCLSFNFFYILFSLPVSVVVLLKEYSDNQYYIPFSFLFFVEYSSNFYIMVAFNKHFRRFFLDIFFKCQRLNKRNQTQNDLSSIHKRNVNTANLTPVVTLDTFSLFRVVWQQKAVKDFLFIYHKWYINL